jgi:hypothetical protein
VEDEVCDYVVEDLLKSSFLIGILLPRRKSLNLAE